MNKATNSSAVIVPPPNTSTNVAGTNDIRDIKAPVPVSGGWTWVAWVLGAAAVLALVWWTWKRWRSKKSKPVPAVIIPAHERARKKLEQALKLIDEPKPFCIAVSDALRVYLEERFGLHAPERTTEEFLLELQATAQLSFSQKQALAQFLERCDLVKFAKFEPPQTALRDLYEAALRLISETEPPPIPKAVEAQSAEASAATK
jgi:Domain of unknown function (DUF4381)